jgi:hypothetical protein
MATAPAVEGAAAAGGGTFSAAAAASLPATPSAIGSMRRAGVTSGRPSAWMGHRLLAIRQ